MQFTAAQISLMLNGTIEGDAGATVSSFGKIEEYLYTTEASITIINDSYQLQKPVKPTLIRVKDAYSAFAQLLSKYQEMVTQQLKGIQQPSYISPGSQIAEDVFVGAFCYIG